MALIECPNCKQSISDKAKACPHCNCELTNIPKKSLCPECGNELLPVGTKICNHCGYEIPITRRSKAKQSDEQDHDQNVLPFGTCRMTINIISIVLFFIIVFQSCSAGVVNTIAGNSESSGSAGLLLAFCWLIAGIVGLSGRKSKAAVNVSSAFYLVGGIIGISNVGVFADLAIWSGLSLAFGSIGLLAGFLKNNDLFQKTGPSVILELVVIIGFLVLGFTCSGNDTTEANPDTKETETVSTEETSADTVDTENLIEAASVDEPSYSLTIDEFLKEVEENETAARNKYLGKAITITGKIFDINSNDKYLGLVAADDDNSLLSSLDCYDFIEDISDCKKGYQVAVTGLVKEDLFQPFALENCKVEITKKVLPLKKINAKVKKKYMDIVDEMGCNYSLCDYAIYDIDEDGIKELIVGFGSCEADYRNDVYTANTKCKVSSAGSFDLLCQLYGAEKGKGIYAVYGHMGYETVTRITLKNGKLKTKELWSKEVPGDYYSNNKEIRTTQVSNEVSIDDTSYDAGGNYILPYSDSCYLSDSDVNWMSSADLRLARNEIYARHGRIFDSADLNDYFNSQSWYVGLYTANEFDESCLNKYEKANVLFIQSYE